MSLAAVAERYARAIFELGVESGQLDPLTQQVRAAADAYSASSDLRIVLTNPLIQQPQREAVLSELGRRLGLSSHALNALRMLTARRRVSALPEISRHLGRLADEKAGVVRATVTSATALPDSYYQALSAELHKATQRKIVLEKQEDPSLIAGIVTQIGDNTIDGSLAGRLHAIERQLLQS